MGKLRYSQLLTLFVLSVPFCYSQTSVKVSDPTLEILGNTIHISYDILNSSPDEKFTITMVVKDEDGTIIKAKALDGDIGAEVNGGNNKLITWNLEADNVFIDAYIFVQINAKRVLPSGEEGKQEDESNKSQPTKTETRVYNRTGLVLQSIAFPGLGLSRVTGNPHWIRGVVGYGCILSSIVLSQKAITTYNGIEDLVYFDEINKAYDEAVKQENTSTILLYAAAGIWITDFIWTLVGTSDLRDKPYSGQAKGFSIGSSMEPFTATPMVCVSYRF